MNVFRLATGSNFVDFYFTDEERNCDPRKESHLWWNWDEKPAVVTERILTLIIRSLWRSNILLQIFEWYAMLNLIKIQKGKHYGQILFDHNAESVRTNELSVGRNGSKGSVLLSTVESLFVFK